MDTELVNTDLSDDITLNYTTAGQLDFSNLDGTDAIKKINFATGANEVILDDATEMSKLASKTLTGLEGDDDKLSLDFDGNLDFSNLEGFEELDLKDGGNNITIDSGNEGTISKITGGSGDDNITLDFSNINNIDGGTGTDTVTLSDSSTAINNSDFANVFNIEALDFSGASNDITLDATALQNIATEPITGFEVNGLSDETSWTIDGFSRYKYSLDGNIYGDWQEVKSIDRTTNGDTGFYQLDTNNDSSNDITLQLTAV